MTIPPRPLQFDVNGEQVEVPDDGASLLEVLRDRLGLTGTKDGCAPQGQCGCCTVLVDGQPRVSCVTPAKRVRGRSVTTIEGLDDDTRREWSRALCSTGGSQCGFCTPGIVVRLAGLEAKGAERDDIEAAEKALAAHICRCTGWQTIIEAWRGEIPDGPRDLEAAASRATIEGRSPQVVSPEVSLGGAGFADDLAPRDALVAVLGSNGWVVGETLVEARRAAGKVQGRHSTVEPMPPVSLPEGDWVRALQTSWVEPGYLETDATWCAPGGEPASVLANGGAFGGKARTELGEVARRLADEHGRAVRVLYAREDAVRRGPKRPPVAIGVRADGTGVMRAARTVGLAEVVAAVAPGLLVEDVDVAGPPTSLDLRGAGWVEALLAVRSVLPAPGWLDAPDGGSAQALVDGAGIRVRVRAGQVLDEVVLRSYCIGAAHMAYSWVTSEGLAVAADGEVQDLTMRSFGILKPAGTPRIDVEVEPSGDDPVNGSDAVFAAVAEATWRWLDFAPIWPTGRLDR